MVLRACHKISIIKFPTDLLIADLRSKYDKNNKMKSLKELNLATAAQAHEYLFWNIILKKINFGRNAGSRLYLKEATRIVKAQRFIAFRPAGIVKLDKEARLTFYENVSEHTFALLVLRKQEVST